jgi:class 3 adenylate cyclase/tetratricopeptide (TPR) repeat protein
MTELNAGLERYVPRLLVRRLAEAPDRCVEVLDGTFVFIDVSGFTKLSERLQRVGREGAEVLVDTINACFTALLADVHLLGGSLVKFGGDALLLWFEGDGHELRGCEAAIQMRRTLRDVGRLQVGSTRITLRMSVGVHSGSYHTFLVGGLYRDLIIAGPAASTLIALENAAEAGQILISPATASQLPRSSLGEVLEPGVLLARTPGRATQAPLPDEAPLDYSDASLCLPPDVLDAVRGGQGAAEHRTATVAFLQYREFDKLIAAEGADEAGRRLDVLVRIAQEAAAEQHVCLIDTDIDKGGGKLRFTAGAPVVVGDDEERLLLTLRRVLDAGQELPIRVGVNRGPVFTGEIGPPYRRTYVVMGDTVNLAARVMGKSQNGAMLATRGVLERSQTKFGTTALAPFMVKGKKRPVDAWEVGAALRAAVPGTRKTRLPLIGRDRELATIRDAIDAATRGEGALVELVGDTGTGKSRLLAEARDLGSEMRFVHATCELYTQGTPYVGWRDPVRQLLGLTWEDPGAVVVDTMRGSLAGERPELLPWLPLLAIVADAETPSTPQVEALAANARTPRLHEVVLEFLAPALAVPTLVEIEHSHLMDEASAALLHALAARLADSSWVVLVTRRDVPTGFVGGAGAVRLELGPLTPQETMALAEAAPEAHLLPQHMLEQAAQRSGGSPEFLLDILASAAGKAGSMPDSMQAAASARIDALDPGDRALVRRAAVLGLTFHPRRLTHVFDREPDERTWQRLSDVFSADPDGHVRFKRPALREVAYAGLPFKTRRELHATVAAALERAVGRDVDADASVLSLHFILAGDHGRAWTYAMMGAERASERFAHADAARLYRRALEAARGHDRAPAELAQAWEALGLALNRTGERKAAAAAFTSARRSVDGDRVALARIYHHHARVSQYESVTGAVRWVNRGLRQLDGSAEGGAAGMRARLLALLAGFAVRQGRWREAERRCRLAMAEAEAAGEPRAQATACYVLDLALNRQGRIDEAIYSPRALELFRQVGDAEQEAIVLNNCGLFASERGAWAEAIDYYRASAECSARAGNAADGASTELNIGEILSDQGRYAEANERFIRAERMCGSTADAYGLAITRLTRSRHEVRTVGGAGAIARLEAAVEAILPFGSDTSYATAVLAEALAADGDPARALALANEVLAAFDRSAPIALRARARALQRLGDSAAATASLREALDAAAALGLDYERACALQQLESVDGLTAAQSRERDAIVARLGIVAWPFIGAGASDAADAPATASLG